MNKDIERAGMTPTRVGTGFLNSARGDSSLTISLMFSSVTRNMYMRITQEGKEIGRSRMIRAP